LFTKILQIVRPTTRHDSAISAAIDQQNSSEPEEQQSGQHQQQECSKKLEIVYNVAMWSLLLAL